MQDNELCFTCGESNLPQSIFNCQNADSVKFFSSKFYAFNNNDNNLNF